MDPPPPPIPISHHHHHHHPGLPHGIETDPNFEPQQRSRANTWPLPRPDSIPETEEGMTLQNVGGEQPLSDPSKTPDPVQVPKKNSSRRNAWGNMSYADLITQAIQNSPDKRLTLSQIYDWMVQNIPYFKDKGDSNSSAGWKNSIRHNLSLHNRFMRVQNESTGKSSWWMINPDAKPGKSARRRATSMETSKYEKKRGRVRKKVEALRNGLEVTTSPASSLSEGLDLFPDSPFNSAYQLSPGDFRPRASSNASSCGRLSPIPAVESESPGTAMSPISWSQYPSAQIPLKYVIDQQTSGYGTEQLVDNLVGSMKIEGTYMGECTGMKQSPQNMSPASQVGVIGNSGFITSNSAYQTNSFIASRFSDGLSKLGPTLPRSPQQRIMGGHGELSQFGLSALQQTLSGDLPVNSSPPSQTRMDSIGSHGVGSYSPDLTPQQRESSLLAHLTSPSFNPSSSYPEPMLRAALTQKDVSVRQMMPPLVPIGNPSTNPSPSQMMGHFMGALNANNTLPSDIDFSLENFQGGLDCNVDEVIKHELSMEGSFDTLDFFPTNGTTNGGQTPMDIGHHGNPHQGSPLTVGQTQVPSLNNPLTSTRSWVR